ncbi:MAG TPA: VapC toxin family PIN domain ribonuclease [Acidobacteria bacterium]|nr:VapC toxin family PIN domain ribonuclease [Alphaproteobacteria bacterium]MBN56230.1 VapC toxin family PIN domain ribonuclease [Oceanospirillaceae bacterium]OUT40361.1 MAG: VapC toxin family PIN domain ribonuclease [Micavibrio sp. TMED2]HCE02886.1 VapC toxin family PIN domain ribonuclease [Acidobacteriota bacterium]MAS47986.1 VapC toxin family PIN domain ribonuclease [Alphaproteobacteria bacterium]|tara:strand:- start:10050 stop:10472 length:423 start_codon:yes stop_codon:yes gene_type:complete
MIILDTNIISELLRPAPEPKVEAWLAAQDGGQVYLTVLSEAELRYGVAILADGERRDALTSAVDAMLREDFRDRILPFDSAAAEAFATIAADRRGAGRPISQSDCQIAAIGRVHNAAVATHNTKDFAGCGVEIIDPWSVT